VGNFCTVLLSVSFRTCLLIFIEISLYLTDREHKISWHVFSKYDVVSKACFCDLPYKLNSTKPGLISSMSKMVTSIHFREKLNSQATLLPFILAVIISEFCH